MALPVRRFAAQQLHVGPQHGVEERVRAAEADLHDGGRGDVGVAIFLEPGHQAGQSRPHVCRAGRTDDLMMASQRHVNTLTMLLLLLTTITYLRHGLG